MMKNASEDALKKNITQFLLELGTGFVVVFIGMVLKMSGIAQKTDQKEERNNALLEYCKEPRHRDEMMKFLGIKHRTTFRSDYLNPFLDEGKIAMTLPDKPQSKNQKVYSV